MASSNWSILHEYKWLLNPFDLNCLSGWESEEPKQLETDHIRRSESVEKSLADLPSGIFQNEHLPQQVLFKLAQTCREIKKNVVENNHYKRVEKFKKYVKEGTLQFVGPSTWSTLEEKVDMPEITQSVIDAIVDMIDKGEKPLVVLDAGKSINALNELIENKETKFRGMDFTNETFAQVSDSPQWMLIPTSDKGVMPNSRNKTFKDQYTYLKDHPNYRMMTAREAVTVAIMANIADPPSFLYPHGTVARTSDHSDSGYRVGIGAFNTSGLHIDFSRRDDFARGSVGLASCRKSESWVYKMGSWYDRLGVIVPNWFIIIGHYPYEKNRIF